MLLFRCELCHTAVWLGEDRLTAVDCSHCEQRYELPESLHGRDVEEIHQRAVAIARSKNVDMASAVSMLFGILELPQVQDFLSGDTPELPDADEESESSVTDIDPAFEAAVTAGTLSRLEAFQRGNREEYAGNLVSRHGISLQEAYEVADNRISLLAVLRRRRAAAPRKLETPARAATHWKLALVAALAGMVVIWGVAREIRSSADEAIGKESSRSAQERKTRKQAARLASTGAGTPTTEPSAELSFDVAGGVTRISAPRPEAVLEAYCRNPAYEPVALAAGVIPDKNLWFGLYRDLADAPEETRAVVIRKERGSGQWVTGDGSQPIQVLTPDPSRLGETRPVEIQGTAPTVDQR